MAQVIYNAEPTLAKFHASNAFIRGIKGPVGCTSGDTEFLTPTGWKRIDHYEVGDKVAQWEVGGRYGKLSFILPERFVKLPCKELIDFRTVNSVSMQLSPEHRMPLYDWKGTFVVRTAEQIAKHVSNYTVPTGFVAEGGLGLTPAEIKLRVMIAADGNYPHQGKQCVMCLRKERKIVRMLQILDECKIPYTEHKINPARPTERVFAFNRPAFQKPLHLSANWYSASSDELAVLLEELTFWDGLYDHEELRFCSTKREEVDVAQFAAHACGRVAHIRRDVARMPGWNDTWICQWTRENSDKGKVKLRVDSLTASRVATSDGFKYCFTLPSSFWLARHNGRIFVTGNSGKSVGMCTEIIRRAMEQTSQQDKVRRSRWGVVRNCFDDQTEILTETRGWQLFKNLLHDDKVAQLSDNGELQYVLPSFYYAASYKGEMIGFENEGVDFLVTPNHKLNVSKKRTRAQTWGAYEFVKAEEIYGSTGFKVKRNASWKGKTDGSPSFFEWLGFWFAEGNASMTIRPDRIEPHWRCVITQKKNPEYVRDLFVRAGLEFTETWDSGVGRFKLRLNDTSKKLIAKLAKTGLATTKRIPLWIKEGSEEQLQAFIRGFVAGDGNIRKDSYCITASTSSEGLADDLQEIALKAGMAANIQLKTEAGTPYRIGDAEGVTTADGWNITFVNPHKYEPALKTYGHKYRGWYKTQYDGVVYCVEVPSHRVYVRRKGRAHWSSQTYIELKMTTIRTWMDWMPDACNTMRWDAPITSHARFPLADGTEVDLEVMFVSMDRPEDIKKLKSFDATGIWINEAVEEPKAILDIATSRVGRYPSQRDGGCAWSGVIMDTNPCDTDHWWYYLAEKDLTSERGRKAWEEIKAAEEVMRNEGLLAPDQPLMEFFSQPAALVFQNGLWVPNRDVAENVAHLNGGFAYYLRQVAGKSHEWINTYLGGNYGKVVDGLPVYVEYADNIHYPGKSLMAQEGIPLIIGLDYGLTPAAAIAQCTSRGQFNILGELCSDGMGIERFLRDALKPYLAANFSGHTFKVYGDPAGTQRTQTDEKTCRMYVEAAGFDYEPAASNYFIPRREAVAYFLNRMVDGLPGLQIDLSCQMIRKGFAGGYHFKRIPIVGEERYKSEPDKNIYSHIHDALQYAALAVGSVQAVAQRSDERPAWMKNLRQSYSPGGFMGR